MRVLVLTFWDKHPGGPASPALCGAPGHRPVRFAAVALAACLEQL